MAVETEKKTGDRRFTTGNNTRNKYATYQGEIRPIVMQVLVLRHLNWSIPQTAQACNVSERSVFDWCKKYKDTFADLPAIQAAKDALQSLIPEAVTLYRRRLRGKNERLGYDIAHDILISNKVIADRKVIEDEREHGTNELVSEAERILAGVSNSPAGSGQAESDPDDTTGS